MGVIGVITTFGLGVLGAALSAQLTSEFKAWTPWLIQRVLGRAIANLPESHRIRFQEELQSHIADVPGEIGKLIEAIKFLKAPRTIVRNALLDQRSSSDALDAIGGEPTMEEILDAIRRVIAEDDQGGLPTSCR